MNRKKRTISIVFVLLLILASTIWTVYRETRQAKLDHKLIAAIKAGNDQKTLEALSEGASGEARDTGESLTLREVLLQMLDHFRHPKRRDEKDHFSALILLYQRSNEPITRPLGYIYPVRFGVGVKSDPNLTAVRALLDHGANVNDQDKAGMRPLHYACYYSNREEVQLLLEHGANIEAGDNNKTTPLMSASLINASGVVPILLEHGANIEAVDNHNETALMYAAQLNSSDVVQLLLEHSAQVNTNGFDNPAWVLRQVA